MISHRDWQTFTFFALFAAAGASTMGPIAKAQGPAVGQPPQALEVTLRDDAALHSVYFVERAIGWAVGDRGVIWHTRDGGANWQQQASQIRSTLKAVFFLDAARGWAVGGMHKPFSPATSGVVLRTVDGGANWTVAVAADQGVLPSLNGVRFFDARHGVAFGDSGAMSPSGVFATRDGGSTWQPLATKKPGQWLAGDFLAPDAGAVAGPNGRFATIAQTEVTDSPLAAGSLRSFRAMRLAAPTSGWLVGDGGFVATTADLGRSWQLPSGEMPAQVAEYFDFRAVAVNESRVWVAGSPGSLVFHSPDAGQTWNAFATGQPAPIGAMTFIDAEHGWAVGEFGAILATRDGGRTWHTQRTGGRRAALLGVFAHAVDAPLEVISQQGAAESYLAAIEIPFRSVNNVQAVETQTQYSSEARTREAMLLAGATSAETAWRLLLPLNHELLGPDELLAALDRANDGRAAERLVHRLVEQIRMWRPEVVITHHGRGDSSDPLSLLVQQMTLKAIAAAADPQQHGELTAAGLEPWQVKRVFGVLPSGKRGVEKIATGQFSPMLGGTLASWSAPARRLLFAGHAPPPDSYELELLTYATDEGQPTDESAAGRGLFRGIVLAPGGDARRRFSALPAGDIDQLRRMAARRRNLEELLQRSEGNPAWAAQVVQLTNGMEAAGGGELVFELADGYRSMGRLDLAADTYYLLARTYPEHPLTEQALRWLIQFYASSEAGLRVTKSGVRPEMRAGASGSASEPLVNVARPEATRGQALSTGKASGTLVQASATSPLQFEKSPAIGLSRDERLRRAVELGKYLEGARPALFAEPGVRFPIVAAERQLGFTNPAKRYFLTLGPLPETDPWRRCAMTEQWLAEPGDSPPPKVLGHCRRAGERPFLDGRIDEPLWQSAEVLRVGKGGRPSPSGTGETPAANGAEVRLTYDNEFIYLAIRAAKLSGVEYQADDRPRPRDADLAAHDRVAVRLDVDRDYATHFELVVDYRGWTRDACSGDATWNPNWYVAGAQDESAWTIEAAIPLAEIAAERPQARTVWALGVRRTIPRVREESWAGEGTNNDSPDQFGLLIFD